MKITIKDGGREESRILKLVSLGLYKNATEATEAAINALYEDALARELAQSVQAQAAESHGLDLAVLQDIAPGPSAAVSDDDVGGMASTSRQPAKLSAKGR
jgi:Arc/MetJ-type ribon-helix-helix transcriptional regulator